jgi:hypothetical protein
VNGASHAYSREVSLGDSVCDTPDEGAYLSMHLQGCSLADIATRTVKMHDELGVNDPDIDVSRRSLRKRLWEACVMLVVTCWAGAASSSVRCCSLAFEFCVFNVNLFSMHFLVKGLLLSSLF